MFIENMAHRNMVLTDELLIILMKILSCFFLLYICLDINAQAIANHLDYNNLDNWEFHSSPFGIRINDPHDIENSFHVFFSKRYLMDMSINWRDSNRPETFDICSSFTIPKDSIQFSFNCKSLKVDSLLLKVNLYKENEIFSRQLVYPLNMDGPNKIGFKNEDAAVMDVHIYGKSMQEYDSIALKITDFNLDIQDNVFPQAVNGKHASYISNFDAIPFTEIYQLNEFKSKKIIGLGESIHGSRSIIQKKRELTERLCEENNIKLICFEAGIDMVMNWDLYIQGVLPDSYQHTIEAEISGSFGEPEIMIGLLNKLRSINKGRKIEDRIHVAGLDLRQNDFYVFEYFKAYKNLRKEKDFLNDLFFKLDTLVYDQVGTFFHNITIGKPTEAKSWVEITPEERKYTSLIPVVEGNKQLMKLINKSDFRYFKEGLLLNIPTKNDGNKRDSIMHKRDDYMWQILQVAIACYAPAATDQIVIHSHSNHLSRTHNPYSNTKVFARKNLGVYIADHYENDFLTVSFHVGNGKFKTYSPKSNKVDIEELQTPPAGSFEWLAGQVFFSDFYCKQSDFETATSFRSIGYKAPPRRYSQFYPLSKYRFDSYIYIDNSFACTPIYWDQQPIYKREFLKKRYIDSLKVTYTPYTLFDYHIPFVNSTIQSKISIPEGFRWKKKTFLYSPQGIINYRSIVIGFFESKDKECIIVINNNLRKGLPQVDKQVLSSQNKLVAKKAETGIMTVAEDLFKQRYSLRPSLDNNEAYQRDKQTLMDRYMTIREESYANAIFNADSVIEIPLTSADDANLKVIGPFRHGEAILIGKKEATVRLNVFYTDKGNKQKEKYRKAIESLIRFE